MAHSILPKSFQNDQSEQPFIQNWAKQSDERQKKAIVASIGKWELFVHFLGLVVTATVIGLHVDGRYWADLGDDGFISISASMKYLQFAAKLHEIIMMTSVSFILLYMLHRRLVRDGVSFGHLDAPYMIGAGGGAGILFTRRFWIPWRQEFFFSVMLLEFILLTLGLNPASAIAMIPSLAYWSFKDAYGLGKGNAFHIYLSLPELDSNGSRLSSPWPTAEPRGGWPISSSCLNRTGGVWCPAYSLLQLTDWVVGNTMVGSSNTVAINDATNYQRLLVSQPLRADANDVSHNVSRQVCSTPTAISTAAVSGFWAYVRKLKVGEISKGPRWPLLKSGEAALTPQPIVYSQCQSDIYESKSVESLLSSLSEPFQIPWEESHKTVDPYQSFDRTMLHDLPIKQAHFGWFHADNVSAMSLANVPIQVSNGTHQDFQSSLMVTCLIDARWAATTVKLKPLQSQVLETNLTDLSIFQETEILKKFAKREDLRREFNISEMVALPNNLLMAMNYDSTSPGSSLFANQLEYLVGDTDEGNRHFSLAGSDTPKKVGSNEFAEYQTKVTDFIGTYQGMALANAMARFATPFWSPYLEIPLGSADNNSYMDLAILNLVTEPYSASIVFPNGTKADSFSINFEASRYGYGYGFRSDDTGTGIYLAIFFLLIYEALIAWYVVVILGIGSFTRRHFRSPAWGSMSNLIALAKNSKSSPYMVGSSAGIVDKNTWRLKVKIREVEDDSLNLVIMQDNEEIGDRPGVGKKYA